jgi:hypothetical protein
MRRAFAVASTLFAFGALPAACVPADGAFGLGSVQFTITASVASQDPVGVPLFTSRYGSWRVHFDRVVLGFRTMTIGKVGDDDRCAFRGRGEQSDIVFDPRRTLVQTFNGISPANCEDTGIFLSPPGDTTDLGPGATARDLFDLAQGDPAHAIIEARAEQEGRTFLIRMRFDTLRTSSRFGGCAGRFEAKGVRVRANERTLASATFAPENMFQDSLGFGGTPRLDPFIEADELGNQDDVFTMDEADKLPLSSVRVFGDGYQLPNGTSIGFFGDFLRALFRFTFFFKEVGTCVGNEPGAEDE